jgi:hypothetical protein
MTLKPFLMGAEVEYSMSSPAPQASARRGQIHHWLLDAIRSEHPWLADIRTPTGIYIDNGSRYYLDAGNHNEFSSPELSTPRQVAVYDRANERILLRAKAAVTARHEGADICVTKNNVNFSMPDRAAWGQHEAYTSWIPLEDAAVQLIPHLVSRIPYAGAGCLSSHAAGAGFELSQRARHMTRLTGMETTHDRAIFCTRAWKPSDVSEAGWTRTNLISKDSQRCSFGMYLTYGVTGLLFMIMNEGHKIGRDVQLKDPLAAMRAFSLDPWLRAKVPLADGRRVTATEIQRAYLRDAQQHVARREYPDWAREVVEYWSVTLDQLEQNPLQLADKLDTYLKLKVFERQLTRANVTWAMLRRALKALDQMRGCAPELVIAAVLNETASGLCDESQAIYRRLIENRELKQVGLDQLRFAVRLQALELNYHELGGWFDTMSDTGQIDSVVVRPEEVERAMHRPPPNGRAEARSELIEAFQSQPWACDWQYVVSQTEEKWVDLRDPFSKQRNVTPIGSEFPPRGRRSELADILVRIAE